jgi:hypothetical protein
LSSNNQPLFPDIFVSLAKRFRRGRQSFPGVEGDGSLLPAVSQAKPIRTLAGEGMTFLANCEGRRSYGCAIVLLAKEAPRVNVTPADAIWLRSAP